MSARLTNREIEVNDLLVKGWGDREIAEYLGMSVKTAKYHVSNILRKNGVKTRYQHISRHKPNIGA